MKEGISNDKKIKAIIFDVGGVLQIGGKPRATSRMMHTSGVHQKIAKKLKISLDQYFDSIDSAYAKSVEGSISRGNLLKTLSINLNYPIEKIEKLYVKAYRQIYKKNKYLFKIAKKLKNNGYEIAILSDQWYLSKQALMQKKDFDMFNVQIVSCDVGMRKPNPEIFHLILDKLKLKAQETIFIDNQTWNLIPASRMGMKTILFTENKKIKQDLAKFGVKIN